MIDKEGAIQEVSNDTSVDTTMMHDEQGNRQHSVGRSEQQPTPLDRAVKKQRVHGSLECPFDRLPESILHDILSRLTICHLLIARRTCVAWHHIVSYCKFFQQLYDERNEESWIALRSPVGNPEHVCLFNIDSNKWWFLQAQNQYQTWLLQGAAEGLMLFVGRDGKLAVANPLTGQFRLLPNTWVTSHLRLDMCLQRKLWGGTTTALQVHLSLSIVVDPAGEKAFKVMVWGELRTRQVHFLVYSSATDTWTTKLCPDIHYRLFRRQFFPTVDGNTIYIISHYCSVFARYKTETGLFVVQQINWPARHWFFRMVVDLVQSLGIIAYRSQILLIGVIHGREVWQANVGHPSSFVGLWQGNPTEGRWELLTTHQIQFLSRKVVAAYDGRDSVTIIPSMGSRMILNLDTKEWKITSSASSAAVTAPALSVWALHMKLKFCTTL